MVQSKHSLIRTLLLAIVTCAFSVCAIADDHARSISLYGLKITPTLNLEYKYDNNIFNTDILGKSSFISMISPALSLQSKKKNRSLTLTYRLNKGVYHSSKNDNYVDHALDFKATADFSKKVHVSLRSYYIKAHDRRGSTFTGVGTSLMNSPDKYHSLMVSSLISYGIYRHLEIEGGYAMKRYDNNKLRAQGLNLDQTWGNIRFLLPIMKKIKFVTEIGLKKFNYQLFTATTNRDSNEQRFLGGINWKTTAKTSGDVRFGYLNKKFNNITSGLFVWELNMKWSPLSYSNLELNTESTFDETDGYEAYIQSTGASIGWQHAWSNKISHFAELRYYDKAYIGQPGVIAMRRDKLLSAAIVLHYQWRYWLKLGLSFDYTKNKSNNVFATYSRNTVTLNILGSL